MIRIIFRAMILASTVALIIIGQARADTNQARDAIIRFQGSLMDKDGLSVDGSTDFTVAYYSSQDVGASPLYKESFQGVAVDRGNFRLPLLRGTNLVGSCGAVTTYQGSELYIDLSSAGIMLLTRYPVGMYLSSIRAERTDEAYTLRNDFKLTNAQIPDHSATLITSGTLSADRIQLLNIGKFDSGTLSLSQIPQLLPTIIATGTFSDNLLPPALDASIFTSGTLKDEVLPDDVLRKDNFYVGAGTVGHAGVIPVPNDYTRDYCQWIVGIKHVDGTDGIDQFRVYADANGVVTCRWSAYQADSELSNYCTASYMIVCMK